MENIFTWAKLVKVSNYARKIEAPKVSRIEQLQNRFEKINLLRNYAIEQNNILKKKQADILLYSLTVTLNLITTPRTWN
jgi:hypothetical protein